MNDPRPLCPTCAHNVISQARIKGEPWEHAICNRWILAFPAATDCASYLRAIGSDDEDVRTI